MATIQIKRASTLAKITAAQLKAGELAVVLGAGADAGKLYVGVDGVAGTAIPVKASGADIANKLANAQNFSITGDVTAPTVSFDGTGAVALQATIADGAVKTAKIANKAVTSAKIADGAVGTTQLSADVNTALTNANSAVQSVTTGTTSGITIGGDAQHPTVAVKVDVAPENKLTVSEAGLKVVVPAADTYNLIKDVDAGDYAAVYHLTKNGTNVGEAINIPKDLFVKSGSIVENPTGQTPGTYIELILQNQEDKPIYINVADLIDAYTGKVGDMITVVVSATNEISATINDNSITLGKLAKSATDVLATKSEVSAVLGTDADDSTKATVYGARALAQQGVNDAAAAKAAADKKIASVTASDKSIVIDNTNATAPAVKVGVSTTPGNALTLDANGLFVATPSSMAAGNGITIENNTVSANVVAANGLSVDAAGIKMALGSATTAGAVKGSTEIAIGADGAMTVNTIDCGEL